MDKLYKNLTIDDIHEIRIENSRKFDAMPDDDICDFIKKAADAFLENVDQKDAVYA